MNKPSRGTSEARGEQESAETSSFRCDCERCRLLRGAVKPSSATHVALCDETNSLAPGGRGVGRGGKLANGAVYRDGEQRLSLRSRSNAGGMSIPPA